MLLDEKKDYLKKDQIEHVEDQKQEYKLIGSFFRSKGLKLYSFNPFDETLHEVKIKYSDTIHVEIQAGKMVLVDKEVQKTTVDTRFVYFEALNIRSAKKRVKKHRNNLTTLCNLKEYKGNNTINFN